MTDSQFSSFFAYISKLRWIKRWGLKRNAHDENVMEHSWEVTEVITGDLPTPIKYHSPAILNAYKQIEHLAEQELLHLLPPAMQDDYAPLLLHDSLPTEHQEIIKAADRISAYLKCQAELKAGNQEFERAASRIAEQIQVTHQPEVAFFMQTFAPSCGLALDDLIPRNDQ
ncbi:MAG: 5'-deoxynucleotidase [Methylococcaceae bacterium]|nr:5'-deoxynucleotidase [Methylococcaceae bacterium]